METQTEITRLDLRGLPIPQAKPILPLRADPKLYGKRFVKHITHPDHAEHMGYLFVAFVIEHSIFRYVILIILVGTSCLALCKDD